MVGDIVDIAIYDQRSLNMFASSKTKWLILGVGILFVLSLFTLPAHADTFTAIQNGDWNAPATWGGAVPTAGDDVTIPPGISVTVPVGLTVTRNGLTTINGTLENLGTVNNTDSLTSNGTLANVGTFTDNGTYANN